jgi:hypothetical protein
MDQGKTAAAEESMYCHCGCRTQAEHDEGQRLQRETRETLGITDPDVCVGCFLGDDGPTMHDYSYGCGYYVG